MKKIDNKKKEKRRRSREWFG